jgi:hypothetical protein
MIAAESSTLGFECRRGFAIIAAMNKPVILSDRAQALAEERAKDQGFESVEAYLDALIEDDGADAIMQDWMRKRIEEGLASPSAGEMTKEKLDRLIDEGIARAQRRK